MLAWVDVQYLLELEIEKWNSKLKIKAVNHLIDIEALLCHLLALSFDLVLFKKSLERSKIKSSKPS